MPFTFVQKSKRSAQLIYVKSQPFRTEILKVEVIQYPSHQHNYFVATVRDVVGHVTNQESMLEVLESMDIVSEISEEVLKAAQVPDAPSAKDLEDGWICEVIRLMGQMLKTWTIRSISSYLRT